MASPMSIDSPKENSIIDGSEEIIPWETMVLDQVFPIVMSNISFMFLVINVGVSHIEDT